MESKWGQHNKTPISIVFLQFPAQEIMFNQHLSHKFYRLDVDTFTLFTENYRLNISINLMESYAKVECQYIEHSNGEIHWDGIDKCPYSHYY